jgi:protein-S-isoprenylcysteine O-methyltransferase Ste14
MESVKLLVRGLITNLVFTLILFTAAGKIHYTQGWIFLAANVLSTFMNFLSIRGNPELAAERAKTGGDIKSWDKRILGLSAVFYLGMIITAGLDSGRFLWSPDFHWPVTAAGLLMLLAGQYLFLTARRQNAFFSTGMRIQKERGQVVCDTGLYKIIRHPGYLGMILSLSAIPLITTSRWSWIPASGAIILLLIRTSLEDTSLRNELQGYVEYSEKTRYRLIPFIW